MSSLSPSFYDTNTGLFQPSQDAYNLWYQQSINFHDDGQHQQSAHPVDGQHLMEPNQPQECYNNYDQMANKHARDASLEATTASLKPPNQKFRFRPECKMQGICSGLGFRLGNSMGLNYPEILVLCLVTLKDAEQLFDMKSGIYQIVMRFAKQSAANALIQDRMKNVELCQAYILMSIYAVPERNWDRDQSWLYTGLAISIAKDLHLDQTSKINSVTESKEHEYLNRVCVWKLCFLFDQATAMQFGKLCMMKDNTIIHHSEECYNALMCIIARFYQEELSDGSRLINLERGNLWDTIMRYNMEIEMFKEEWKRKFKAEGIHHGAMFRCSKLHFYVAFIKLVIFSFGFHQVFHAGIEAWYDYFLIKCFEYAKSVIRCMNEDLAPSGFMRYAPDRNFMCTAFAVVSLFKDESVKLIEILINKLSSSDIAVDDRHTPKLNQETAFEGSLTNSSVNTGTSRNITGEMDKESSDNCITDWPEAIHAVGSWPIQFGSIAELFHTMDGSQNINGDSGQGGQSGNIEDDMIMSLQNLDNTEWFQGMLMPGYGFPGLAMMIWNPHCHPSLQMSSKMQHKSHMAYYSSFTPMASRISSYSATNINPTCKGS
ncbi:hypothetical protein IW262DRAFT_1300599 [Armillaria fumosa]|nr:hypothetical protein IW262DRAFT_1300599 [Armillaria fumosa]